MTAVLKKQYHSSKERIRFFWSVNWLKTLYFNFRKFPFATASKLPVYFYGKVRFADISGQFLIDAPIKSGMIGFGQPYEIISRNNLVGELAVAGTILFKGHVQFGKGYFVYVHRDAHCQMGHLSSLGGSGKLICYSNIHFGDFARVGFESQIIDTTFHQMYDTLTGDALPKTGSIRLGDYNYLGNRVNVMRNTITPNNCTVASGSLCNKDYTANGENVLLSGTPARLIRSNISRDWASEMRQLERWLIV